MTLRLLRAIFCLCLAASVVGCAPKAPTEADASEALTTWYRSERSVSGDLRAQIIRVGEAGKGDFAAPGSQDNYWPVEFKIAGKPSQLGPLQLAAADKFHGVANLWRDKLGSWRVGRVEVIGAEPERSGVAAREAKIREQLAASLRAAPASSPPPSLSSEISVDAPRVEWEGVSAKIIAAVEGVGGSAAKGLPESTALIIFADIPSARIAEFRQALARSGVTAEMPPPSVGRTSSPDARTILQIRISESR